MTGVAETALAEGQGAEEITIAGAEGGTPAENTAVVALNGYGTSNDGATGGDASGDASGGAVGGGDSS